MKQASRRWVSVLVVLSLVLSLIPTISFAAGGEIVITDPRGDQNNPAQVSSKKVDITGSILGVTDIKYSITQYRQTSTGLVKITSRAGVEKPLITGSTFSFSKIDLYDGLNLIDIYGNNGAIHAYSYVEVSTMPVIISMNYNQQDLTSNNIVTDKLFNSELYIKGDIVNADSIAAKVNGSTTELPGSILNNGTYIVKIPVQRGKNSIELIARNLNKTYPVKLDVIWDDGDPYISGNIYDNATTSHELRDPSTFSTSDLTIVNGVFHNFTTLPDDDLEISLNSTKFNMKYSAFDNLNNGGVLDVNTPGMSIPAGITITKTGTINDPAAQFTLSFTNSGIPNLVKQNTINVLTFTLKRGGLTYSQKFNLDHLDPTVNSITNITGLSDVSTSKQITFYVTTKNAYAGAATLNDFVLHSYLTNTGTKTTPTAITGSKPNSNENTYQFTVTLQPGINFFDIYPNSSGDPTNMRQRVVRYVNSPDVKILNLVNGDRIGGDTGLGTMLEGELLNISLNDRDKTKITVENRGGRTTQLLNTTTHFTDSSNNFKFQFNLLNDGKIVSGANDIVIEVTDGTTITTTRITLFYFATSSPIVTVGINELATKTLFPGSSFKKNSDNNYDTESRFVHVTLTYDNSNEVYIYYNGVQVATVQKADDDTNRTLIPTTGWTGYFSAPYADPTNTYYLIDTLFPFSLVEGQNTFEIEGFSNDGVSRSEKLYIKRNKPAIKILKPDLDREKVVNSNYIEVMIEAPADKVKVGKTDAVYQKLSNDEVRQMIQALPTSIRDELITRYGLGDLSDDKLIETVDQSELTNKRFVANVILKPGKNKITIVIETNGNKTKTDFEIYYAASPSEGAGYRVPFKGGKIDVFDKKVNIEFPKNTWLVKKSDLNQGLKPIFDQFQAETFLNLGIVDRNTGMLNKVWDDIQNNYVLDDFNEPFKTIMPVKFLPPDRSGYAGPIYWIESDGEIKDVDGGLVPTNRAKLTLVYDPSIRDDAQNLLAIYHFDRDKEEWVNIGGVVDTKKKAVSTYITEFGYYAVMAKRGTYNDIYNHWAINYLTAMFAKGLMMPEAPNRFGSDMLTSRGEFTTVLVKATEIPIDAGPYINGDKRYPASPTFVDVNPLLDPPNGFYSYEYIETAGRAGIIRGMGQGEFVAEGLLTREQAAIMIARAANMKLTSDTTKLKASLSKDMADVNLIGDYALPYVEAVLKAGVMTGSPIANSKLKSFDPSKYLTRAEAAAIAYKLMQTQKKLPK